MPKPKTADPVFPNAGVEAWYRAQLQGFVRRMAQNMLDRVRAAWREGGGLATDALAMDARPRKPTPALLRAALERWGGLWIKRMEKASLKLATDFARRSRDATEASMRKTLSDAGFTVRFKPGKLATQAYEAVIAEQVGLIRSIPQKYLTDVQAVVWDGVMQGMNMKAIAEQIQAKYGIAHRRAALIAGDQNHKAKAAMERARRKEIGIKSAIWQHSGGGVEPRESHLEMDEKSYDVDEGMYDYAVDKRVWPGTEINCRCTDRAVVPGFE